MILEDESSHFLMWFCHSLGETGWLVKHEVNTAIGHHLDLSPIAPHVQLGGVSMEGLGEVECQ
jgi:hypothetical protein